VSEDEYTMAYREFTVTGKIYSPNESVAKHRVYWAIANSEHQDEFLIDEVTIKNGETK
jgi:hypothetical protein